MDMCVSYKLYCYKYIKFKNVVANQYLNWFVWTEILRKIFCVGILYTKSKL